MASWGIAFQRTVTLQQVCVISLDKLCFAKLSVVSVLSVCDGFNLFFVLFFPPIPWTRFLHEVFLGKVPLCNVVDYYFNKNLFAHKEIPLLTFYMSRKWPSWGVTCMISTRHSFSFSLFSKWHSSHVLSYHCSKPSPSLCTCRIFFLLVRRNSPHSKVSLNWSMSYDGKRLFCRVEFGSDLSAFWGKIKGDSSSFRF